MLLPVVRTQWVSLLSLYFASVGFVVFLYGFFPLKYHGGTDATWADLPSSVGDSRIEPKKFYVRNRTRVVLMVVDALRFDFVDEKYMPFATSLVKSEKACLFKAQAEPPTVTMPRIKSTILKRDKAQWRRTVNLWRDLFAMTTGSISNFIDVALNFGSSAVTEDNIINQCKLNNKNLVFYGDDTWLRLFPNSFLRSEGTTSFFVSDYTQVDLNVTRNLPKELTMLKPDWDLLILHYLGLDHIGHLEGPSSPKIIPKMMEMDSIFEMIVNASRKWTDETVIVICGDHGMKDSGSHGGASYNEITVPLILTQNKGCPFSQPNEVDQIDIAPTLSYLLNIPIPGGSTGQILPQVLTTSSGNMLSKESLYALYYNAKINSDALEKILGKEELLKKECYQQFLSAVKHHADSLNPAKTGSPKMAASLYKSSLNNMSHYLTKSIVEFDMFALILGVFIILMTFISQILITTATFKLKNDKTHENFYGFVISTMQARIFIIFLSMFISCSMYTVVCGVSQTESELCKANVLSIFAVGGILIILTSNIIITRNINKNLKNIGGLWSLNIIEVFLISGTIVQPLTFGGTSFIEEEHQTWYFFWTSVTFLVLAYTTKVLLEYFHKRSENATEVQDKESLSVRMDRTAKSLWPQWIILMILHRFLRTLNQTGDKWAFLPDVGDWLNADENYEILSLLSIAALFSTTAMCQKNLQTTLVPFKINCLLMFSAILCIFFYRIATQSIQMSILKHDELNDIYIIRIFWIIIFFIILIEIWSTKQYISHEIKNFIKNPVSAKVSFSDKTYGFAHGNHPDHVLDPTGILLSSMQTGTEFRMKMLKSRINVFINVMMLICSLYLRPHNLILIPSICITSKIVNTILDHKFDSIQPTHKEKSSSKNVFCKTLFHLWMGSLFYFYQGNSNSLASVDIGSGYIGLESYIPSIVALQMGIHTYTGPILSILLLFANLIEENYEWDKFSSDLKECLSIISIHRMFVLLVYSVICILLRYHLFVWTVFSPKLLFEFGATFFTIGTMLIMMIICSSITLQEHLSLLYSKFKVITESHNFED